MKKLIVFLGFILTLLFSVPIFASGRGIPVPPDGVVYGLQIGSTVYGIERAMSDRPDAFIMMKQQTENVLFAWQIENAAAFTCLNTSGANCAQEVYDLIKSSNGGNVLSVRNMLELRNFLSENGWTVIKSSEVPLTIRAMMTGASLLSQLAQSCTTVLILPVGVFDVKPYQTWKG